MAQWIATRTSKAQVAGCRSLTLQHLHLWHGSVSLGEERNKEKTEKQGKKNQTYTLTLGIRNTIMCSVIARKHIFKTKTFDENPGESLSTFVIRLRPVSVYSVCVLGAGDVFRLLTVLHYLKGAARNRSI